jgi:hypothetical protein
MMLENFSGSPALSIHANRKAMIESRHPGCDDDDSQAEDLPIKKWTQRQHCGLGRVLQKTQEESEVRVRLRL